MATSDVTLDLLRDSGLLDEAALDQLETARAADPGGTWSDAVSGIGLASGVVADVLDLAAAAERAGQLSEPGVTGESAGRYVPLSELGAGGMGRVDLVDDLHLHRRVARKELLSPHPELAARFLREARITAQLEHPGIVPVYELGRRGDGALYYTMRRVRGQTLADAIQAAPTLGQRLALIGPWLATCQAVAYAHSRGVIHRDLKPDNVMLGRFGETLVVDWGLARAGDEPEASGVDADATIGVQSGDDSKLTRSGRILGTPRYMSPEQASGRIEQVDKRSDVWSLGAILFELVAGVPPFQGNAATVLAQVVSGQVPDLARVCPEAPGALVEAVRWAMSADPVERPQDAALLAQAVETWRNTAVETASQVRAATWMARLTLASGPVMVLFGLAFAALAVWHFSLGEFDVAVWPAISAVACLVTGGWVLSQVPRGRAQLVALRGDELSVIAGRRDVLEQELSNWVGPAARVSYGLMPVIVVLALVSPWVSPQIPWWLGVCLGACVAAFFLAFGAYGAFVRIPKVRSQIAELDAMAQAERARRASRAADTR